MILRTATPLWLCALLTLSLTAEDGVISVVIDAAKPSRPAHFTWKFTSTSGKAPQIGQFACGSYWVAPADGEASVVFVSLTGSPEWTDMLSCDADPITERHGLLNGKNKYGSHDPSENVLPNLPVTYAPKADSCVSLVAAMQRDEAATSNGGTRQIVGEVVDAYCVVTVMPQAPRDGGANMIRPNITGATKEFLTWNDFDLGRIPSYDFLEGKDGAGWASTQRNWSHAIEIFGLAAEDGKKPGSFNKFSEGGRAFRSHLLVPDYAAGTARVFNGDLLALFSPKSSLDEKKPALAAMLAYGLDIYHARYNYGDAARKCWSSGAGQSLGTFLPPVFAAALLRDESKAHRLRQAAITNHGSDPGEVGPHELRQITRGVTGVLLWGDYHPFNRPGNKMVEGDWRYWADLMASSCYDGALTRGSASAGKKTAADPYGFIDGPANAPGSSYMSVSFGGFRALAAAMILMPEIRSIVNTDAPIEYVDRVLRHGIWAWPDPVAAPTPEDQKGCSTWWESKGCTHWQVKWGPRPDDIRFAIEDGVGRFRSVHGKPLGTGYETGRAESNWPAIIALYTGPKFEDNAVELGVVVTPEIRFATGDAARAHLFCATPDATIHYTLDGSEPSTSSAAYAGDGIPVTATQEVKAIAVAAGKKASATRSGRLPPPLAKLSSR